MIEIYARVQQLDATVAEVITMRLLATIGQRARKGTRPTVYIEGELDDDARSVFGFLRDRLRGRVLHDLRRWVELHSGQTRVALLDIYVKHAMKFVEDLSETHNIHNALEIYRDMVGVPLSMKDSLHMFVLDKLATDELPKGGARLVLDSEDAPVPARSQHHAVS